MNRLKEHFRKQNKESIVGRIFIVISAAMLIGMFTTADNFFEEFITAYRLDVPTGAPYLERIEGAIKDFEQTVDEDTFRRNDFIELYGLSQRVQGRHIITDPNYGALYKTKYGQTTFAVQERDVTDSVISTYNLANLVLSTDSDFLYIQLPFKIPNDKYDGYAQLPLAVDDYSNRNADEFLAQLRAGNIPCYDVRDQFWTSGKTQNELFFNTDHHWTIEGAFMTTGFIADYLNANYNFGIKQDLYTPANFNFETYENDYIGSMGRRVGRIYGGVDDFTLITPNFDTDYTLTQIEGISEVEFTGTFEEAILDWEYLTDPDITTNRYAIYHGDFQELRFVNNLVDNDKKILIIKDSFGIPIYSFLSLGIHEVRAIDMRIFKQNVADYVAAYKPDLVILMYNADSFVNPMFDFHLEEGTLTTDKIVY